MKKRGRPRKNPVPEEKQEDPGAFGFGHVTDRIIDDEEVARGTSKKSQKLSAIQKQKSVPKEKGKKLPSADIQLPAPALLKRDSKAQMKASAKNEK